MRTLDVTEQTERAAAGWLRRLVSWPGFWLLWCEVFGIFAAICWMNGFGSASISAFAVGVHLMGFIQWFGRWIEAS